MRLIVALLISTLSCNALAQQCEEDELLYSEGSPVEGADHAFFSTFEEHCGVDALLNRDRLHGDDGHEDDVACEIKGNLEPKATTMYNYTAMVESEKYAAYVDACGALGDGYDICTVDVMYGDMLAVTGEPLCLPPSCNTDDSDIRTLLNEQPCATDDCAIELISFSCGTERAADTSTVSCEDAAETVGGPSIFLNDLELAKTLLVLSMTEICLSSLLALTEDASLACQLIVEPVEINLSVDLDAFQDEDTYKSYIEACNMTESMFCTSSFNLDLSFDLLIQGTFIIDISNVPFCTSSNCDTEDVSAAYLAMVRDAIFDDIMKVEQGAMSRKLSVAKENHRTLVSHLQENGADGELDQGAYYHYDSMWNDANSTEGETSYYDYYYYYYYHNDGASDYDYNDGAANPFADLDLNKICADSMGGEEVSELAQHFSCSYQVYGLQCNGEPI